MGSRKESAADREEELMSKSKGTTQNLTCPRCGQVLVHGTGPLISDAMAFDLQSTYGFPIEMTQEEAKRLGMEKYGVEGQVDIIGYKCLMEQHKAKSRGSKLK